MNNVASGEVLPHTPSNGLSNGLLSSLLVDPPNLADLLAAEQLATEQLDILIVDDTPDNLRLLLKVLTEQGYSVRPSTSGKEAIAAAQIEPPDLILLDVKMPDIDGYELCKRLKANERTRDIPILFLTVLDDVADIVKGFELGGVDYITKPVRAGELLARVKNQAQQQQLKKQLILRNQALQQAIDQSAKTKLALRETEDRFVTAFENSPLPLSLTSIPLVS